MIQENVWGPGYRNEVNYLKVYAYRIRRTLGDQHGLLLQCDPSVCYPAGAARGRRLNQPMAEGRPAREPRCRVP